MIRINGRGRNRTYVVDEHFHRGKVTPRRFELAITTLKGWCLNQLDYGARFHAAGAAVHDSIWGLPISDYPRWNGRGRNRTYVVSDVGDLQSLALAARHTLPYTLTGTRTRNSTDFEPGAYSNSAIRAKWAL